MTLNAQPASGRTRGVVLGAGGVLGAAWTIGALTALQDHHDWDPRNADVLLGTSAGSVLAAFLGCGVGVDVLLDHQRGIVSAETPDLRYDLDRDPGGSRPPLPRPGVGSARGMLATALQPWKVTPMGALATVLPKGRGSLAPIGRLVDAVCPPGAWAAHPQTWVVAMDHDSGRRVCFGRDGAPHAGLSDAVMASCAIPGWYTPIAIGGRRYVDGGTCSPTSLDLVSSLGLDEVVVLSPSTSLSYDRPSTVGGRVERRIRRLATRRLLHEAQKVAATGTRVTLLGPGAEDLAGMGANLMDARRRQQVLETSVRTSLASLRSSSLSATG